MRDIVPLDTALPARIQAIDDEHAAQGLRSLGVAWKPAPSSERIQTPTMPASSSSVPAKL